MNPSYDSGFWDQRYGRTDYVFGTAPNDFLAAVAPDLPPGPVLCLAEGEGRNAVFLAARGHAVTAVDQSAVGLAKASALAHSLAADLRRRKAIMGVFDEGCMGMYNAILPDELLHPTGVFKERLSQSSLYAAMLQTPKQEAQEVRCWLDRKTWTAAARYCLVREPDVLAYVE